jgi:hypothetical protein
VVPGAPRPLASLAMAAAYAVSFTVVRAENFDGETDAYVAVLLDGTHLGRTEKRLRTTEPVWAKTFRHDAPHNAPLKFRLTVRRPFESAKGERRERTRTRACRTVRRTMPRR